MRARVSDTKIKSTVNVLIYIALSAVGVIWIQKSFEAYFEGKTIFIEEHQFLTNADKPTLTICFEHEQPGLHYWIAISTIIQRQ